VKQIVVILLLCFLFISFQLSAQIVSGNCFIQGNYVELGIGPCGVFGTTVDAPPGYHPRGGDDNPFRLGFVADQGKDGWNVGSPNYCGDYYVPGTPEEGWGITMNGINYNNNLLCDTPNISGSIISYMNNGITISGTWTGAINGLAITAKTIVPINKLYFLTEVTMKNTTADTIRNLYYMRNIDPDNEVTLTGDYTTTNTIVSQNPNVDNKAIVTAEGLVFGCFIGLGTRDCRAKVAWGGFSNRSAQDAWNCVMPQQCSGTETDDIAITISFKLGNLAPGQQTSLKFVNVLNLSDLDEAVDLTGPSFLIGGTASINSNDTTEICSSGPTILEVINTGGFDSWTWSPAIGLNTTTGPLVICNGNIDTITYTAMGQNNCGSSINIHFTAIKGNLVQVPKAGPISGPTSLCLPNATAVYSIAPIAQATKYQWKVPNGASILSGDGTTSITVNLGSSMLYDSISVYGINVCGPGDTSLIRVTVCDCYTIYPVVPAATSICPNDSVQLITTAITGAVYKWYRNGILLPVSGPAIFVKDTGNYNVIIYPNGFCVNTSSVSRVDFATLPVVTLSPSGRVNKCQALPVTITANVIPNAPGPVIFDWYKDGVLVAANGPSSFSALQDGVYFVKITNSFSCKASSQNDTVISHQWPTLIKYGFVGDSITCQGRNGKLTSTYFSTDGNVTGFAWYNNGVLIPGATDSILNVNSSGNYSVNLTTVYGCNNIVRDTQLIFYPLPVAAFILPDGCFDGNLTFTDTSKISGGSITNWVWKKDGTVFSTSQNVVTNFPGGLYNIELMVRSDKGCWSDTATSSFLRYGKPMADFSIAGKCSDSLTTFNAISISPGYGNNNIMNWNWDLGNGQVTSILNPSLIYGDAGYYTVQLKFNGNNCSTTQSVVTKRIYLGDPIPAMRYYNVIALEGEQFILYGGRDGINYSWYPTIGLTSPNSRVTTGSLTQNQLYNVHVINSNGCGRTDTVQVVILSDCKIYVPTAFTPNHDGLNDKLRIYFGCLQLLHRFTIFNRWGQVIFTTKNGFESWDGKYKDVDQPKGTYLWIAEGEYKSGKKFSEKGTFVLIR
jgi:gliding motility-associated-like protein